MNKDTEIVNIRKLQYPGHIMRNESRYLLGTSSHFARENIWKKRAWQTKKIMI